MKDDFSKASAFQNLVCASNMACLFWSHCFYWTLSELLQKIPHPLCCSCSQWTLWKPPHNEKKVFGLVKRHFLGSLSAFLSYNKTDLTPYIHFRGKTSHLVSTTWWRRYWLWRFQAIVKMLFNWKINPSILKEIKSKCSRKIKEL